MISAMPCRMRSLNSSQDWTRIWRRKVGVILPNNVSTMLSHEPWVGVCNNGERQCPRSSKARSLSSRRHRRDWIGYGKLFAKEGAYVFITGRRQKELDEAVKAIGANVSGVQGDVAQLADLDRLYETISKVKGRIDIAFANAGVGEFVPFGAVTEEHFDKLFNINVRGTLFTVQKALPLLNDGGFVILNGSVASVKGTAAFGVYAASKAAIRSFVRTWTTDLKDRRIRSNVVSPGPINTPLASRLAADVIARIVSTVPMGRMGKPEEVAKVALFLASDDSSFVTGIELFVDGGRAQI